MPPKKLTANPKLGPIYRTGKPSVEEPESSSSEEEDSNDEQQKSKPKAPVPNITSFPKRGAGQIISRGTGAIILGGITGEDKAKREDEIRGEAARKEAERYLREEGFETVSESESGSEEESGSEKESEEEESSSEDEATARRRQMIRPVFVRKDQRKQATQPEKTEDEEWREEVAEKKQKAEELVQAQLGKNIAEREAARRNWDDDEAVADLEGVDDEDDVDPEGEYAAWKLRELRRIKRDREAIEEAECEREEIERRRNLTQEERDAEDREKIEEQKREREGRGTMAYKQRYFHKGAFFTDELKEAGLDKRDIMGAKFEDEVQNKELLPKYMQIRDMNRLGKKGRTRYEDMKTEDTGKWGDFGDRRGPRGGFQRDDERFKADRPKGREGATGANSAPVGERKRYGDEGGRDLKRPRIDDR